MLSKCGQGQVWWILMDGFQITAEDWELIFNSKYNGEFIPKSVTCGALSQMF